MPFLHHLRSKFYGQTKECAGRTNIDPEKDQVEQLWFKSKDGTRVPMFVVSKIKSGLKKWPQLTLRLWFCGWIPRDDGGQF